MLPPEAAKALTIRLLHEQDVISIDRVFRAAFGKQVGHPDPENFAPGRSCLARLVAEPDGCFGAFISEELVAVAFATVWGKVGVFGPLAVQPTYWSLGVGKQLLQRSIEFFERAEVTDMVLCTFPDSPKHLTFYKKYGFHPRSLIAMMSRIVPLSSDSSSETILPATALSDSDYCADENATMFSLLNKDEKSRAVAECLFVSDSIFEGLDLSKEIEVADKLSIGETVLFRQQNELVAFAVCHFGSGSETETDVFYIKFAAAMPHWNQSENFRALLKKCAKLARVKNTNMMFFGVNTARQEAFELLLSEGFRIDSMSVAMQAPNQPAYNHGGIFVIDDWR